MKKLLLGLSLFSTTLGFSQIDFSDDFSVELSRPYDVVDAAVKEYYPVEGGNKIISIKASNEGVTVALFDVDGMREMERSQTTNFQKYAKYIDIVYVDDSHFYYIYEVYNKANKTFTVYQRPVDVEGVELGTKQKLFTTTRPVSSNLGGSFMSMGMSNYNYLGMPIKPHFYVKTSFDKSKILITYRLKPKVKDDKKNYDVIGMHVYDNEMTNIWGEEIKMPYTEAVMNNLAYGVGNKGHGLVMLQRNDNKKYELLGFSEDDKLHFEIDIETDILFQRFEIEETPEGNFLFSGMYANGIDVKVSWQGNVSTHFNTDGLYMFTLDTDGELLNKNKIPFDLDFIGLYLSDRERAKVEKREAEGKAGISDLRIGDIHVNEDGSKVFICERQWVETRGKTTVFRFTNMVAMKINKDGTVDWVVKLPKNQEGYRGVGGMSYKYIYGKNEHYIVYLDNAKNSQLPVDAVPEKHIDGKGGILTTYVINNEDGDVNKHLLFDVKDVNGVEIYQFKTSRIFEAVSGTFFTEVYLKKKMDGMIKMMLK